MHCHVGEAVTVESQHQLAGIGFSELPQHAQSALLKNPTVNLA